MTQHTRAPNVPDGPSPALGAAALREWNGHVESVMRGMAHALNNRAAALSAVIELSGEVGGDPAEIGSILSSELERVQELTRIVRAIGNPLGGSEAVSPRDAANEAIAVLKLHANQRDDAAVIGEATATPTRVPKWMFVRALVALAAAASDHCQAPVRVDVVEDGDWIVTRVAGVRDECVDVSPYAVELARAMGGEPLAGDDACGFRIPTLAAIRRREAR